MGCHRRVDRFGRGKGKWCVGNLKETRPEGSQSVVESIPKPGAGLAIRLLAMPRQQDAPRVPLCLCRKSRCTPELLLLCADVRPIVDSPCGAPEA